jgi:uncharacterized protein YjbJ (UPF0337 family)
MAPHFTLGCSSVCTWNPSRQDAKKEKNETHCGTEERNAYPSGYGSSGRRIRGDICKAATPVIPLNQLPDRALSVAYARRTNMGKDHVEGAVDNTKGAVKDAVGGLTGNTGLQAEGKIDKAKGTAKQAKGDVKDAARDAIDKA